VSPVRYKLGFITEDAILQSHRREDLRSYTAGTVRKCESLNFSQPHKQEMALCTHASHTQPVCHGATAHLTTEDVFGGTHSFSCLLVTGV
jgi:hypothetical protein